MTNLTILYATDDMTSRLHNARLARDWHIFCPATLNEALALAVFYAPHAIVVDGDSDWLNELALNVTGTTGPSPRMKDIVVRLADTPLSVDVPDFIDYHALQADIAPNALAKALAEMDARRTEEQQTEPQLGAA